MAGQLGTLLVGAQLATENTPDAPTTDRSYFGISFSTAGSSTPPDWDRYNMWGILGSYQNAGASNLLANKIVVIPHWFNRTGRIKAISTVLHTPIGNPANLTLGLYGVNLDGQTFPGRRLYESSEIALDTAGSAVLVTVLPDLLVGAGTLLFLAIANDSTIVPDLGCNTSFMPGLIGTKEFGGAFTPTASDFDLISGFRIDAAYGSGANRLPQQFPVAGTIAEYGPQQGAGLTVMPAFAFRFLKV